MFPRKECVFFFVAQLVRGCWFLCPSWLPNGTVNLAVEHAHSLGEFRSAPVANQFMDRLLELPWYDVCTLGQGVINILRQEFVGGGGISRPSDNALYGTGDYSPLCGAQRSRRSKVPRLHYWHIGRFTSWIPRGGFGVKIPSLAGIVIRWWGWWYRSGVGRHVETQL